MSCGLKIKGFIVEETPGSNRSKDISSAFVREEFTRFYFRLH